VENFEFFYWVAVQRKGMLRAFGSKMLNVVATPVSL
jgi:hypothetical protein